MHVEKQFRRRLVMTRSSSRAQVVLGTVGVAMALLLAALDQTIVGVAMPRIVSELYGLHYYAWVSTAYLITSTALALAPACVTSIGSGPVCSLPASRRC